MDQLLRDLLGVGISSAELWTLLIALAVFGAALIAQLILYLQANRFFREHYAQWEARRGTRPKSYAELIRVFNRLTETNVAYYLLHRMTLAAPLLGVLFATIVLWVTPFGNTRALYCGVGGGALLALCNLVLLHNVEKRWQDKRREADVEIVDDATPDDQVVRNVAATVDNLSQTVLKQFAVLHTKLDENISTLGKAVGSATTSLEHLSQQCEQGVGSIRDASGKLSDAVSQIDTGLENVDAVAKEVRVAVNVSVETVRQQAERWGETIARTEESYHQRLGQLDGVHEQIAPVVGRLSSVVESMGNGAESLRHVAERYQANSEVVERASTSLEQVVTKVDGGVQAVNENLNRINAAVEISGESVRDYSQKWQEILEGTRQKLESSVGVFQAIGDDIRPALGNLAKSAQSAANGAEQLEAAAERCATGGNQFNQDISKFGGLVTQANDALNRVNAAVQTTGQLASRVANEWEQTVGQTDQVLRGSVEHVRQAAEYVRPLLGGIQEVQNAMTRVAGRLEQVAQRLDSASQGVPTVEFASPTPPPRRRSRWNPLGWIGV